MIDTPERYHLPHTQTQTGTRTHQTLRTCQRRSTPLLGKNNYHLYTLLYCTRCRFQGTLRLPTQKILLQQRQLLVLRTTCSWWVQQKQRKPIQLPSLHRKPSKCSHKLPTLRRIKKTRKGLRCGLWWRISGKNLTQELSVGGQTFLHCSCHWTWMPTFSSWSFQNGNFSWNQIQWRVQGSPPKRLLACSFQSLQIPPNRESKEKNRYSLPYKESVEAVFSFDLFDRIENPSLWSAQPNTALSWGTVRSLLWPGYLAYVSFKRPCFGGVYYGNGLKQT